MVRPPDGVIDDFGDPERSGRAVWIERVAHVAPWFILAYLAQAILYWFGLIKSGWWSIPIELLMIVPVLISILHVHLARMCLRCIQGTPLNPNKVARRDLDLMLRWSHNFSDRRWWYVGWYFSLLLAMTGVRLLLGVDSRDDVPWTGIPTTLFFLGTMWSFWKHHRYRPWCPYCKDWGSGGDREPSPDPVGDGTKTNA